MSETFFLESQSERVILFDNPQARADVSEILFTQVDFTLNYNMCLTKAHW